MLDAAKRHDSRPSVAMPSPPRRVADNCPICPCLRQQDLRFVSQRRRSPGPGRCCVRELASTQGIGGGGDNRPELKLAAPLGASRPLSLGTIGFAWNTGETGRLFDLGLSDHLGLVAHRWRWATDDRSSHLHRVDVATTSAPEKRSADRSHQPRVCGQVGHSDQ